MLRLKDRNLGRIIYYLQARLDRVRILVIYVIGIHIDLIAVIRNDLIDQRSDVGLILAQIIFLKKLIVLQKDVIVDRTALAVSDVIGLVKLIRYDSGYQNRYCNYNSHDGLRKDPFFTVFSV